MGNYLLPAIFPGFGLPHFWASQLARPCKKRRDDARDASGSTTSQVAEWIARTAKQRRDKHPADHGPSDCVQDDCASPAPA